MNQPIAKFWIPGTGVGKGRPSIHWHYGQTYVDYTQSYKSWINHAAQLIEYQSKQYISPGANPVRVECSFVNFLSSDSDNLQGAVLDAMVGSTFPICVLSQASIKKGIRHLIKRLRETPSL